MKNRRLPIPATVVAAVFFATGAVAQPELLMRSGPESAYQIPSGSVWNSKTPAINDASEVALGINAVAPSFNAGIWKGDRTGGGVVHVADSGDVLYFDVDINAGGDIVWSRGESAQNGIMKYTAAADTTALLTNAPIGASSWGNPQINAAGQVGYRAGFSGGNGWVSFDDGSTAFHLAEAGIDSNSDFSFLFTPAFNELRQIGGKAATDSHSVNRILVAEADGSFTVLVGDNNLDPKSPFSNFDNSVGLNEHGQVAFIATLAAGGRGVYVADEQGWTQYAVTGEDGLDSLEFFAPRLNNAGQVAFRGFNDQGERAIWLADGDAVRQILTEGAVVTTDLGESRVWVVGETAPGVSGNPVFGGSVALNNQGEVAVVARLTAADDTTVNHGLGLFIVATAIPDPVFFDRFEAGEMALPEAL